jgi:hypothetical protein
MWFRILAAVVVATSFADAELIEPVRRGIVGVTVRAGESTDRVMVSMLDIDSPAYATSLRPGDHIVEVNGKPVNGVASFRGATGPARTGDVWTLRVQRGDQVEDIRLVASEAPRERSSDEFSIEYAWCRVNDGTPLRMLFSIPKGGGGGPTVIVFSDAGIQPVDSKEDAYYRELSRTLAQRGCIVVRFEPRGVGDSYGGPYAQLDLENETGDAIEIVRAVMGRTDVDRRKVHLLGLGLGGVVATRVAARQDGIAGVITWGTQSRPLLETLIESTREHALLQRLPAADVDVRVRGVIEEFGQLLHPQSDAPAEQIIDGKCLAYWRQLDRTPFWRTYGQCETPLLVLYGEHDYIARLADQRNAAALAGGRREVGFHIVPAIDHFMNGVLSRAESMGLQQTRQSNFQPDVVRLIVSWIGRHQAKGRLQFPNGAAP